MGKASDEAAEKFAKAFIEVREEQARRINARRRCQFFLKDWFEEEADYDRLKGHLQDACYDWTGINYSPRDMRWMRGRG